ncbi:MAG: ABC transporter permease [Actinomycetota bacterium]|nr:ABC transporter permease [Actinomycetota bacterium]
MRKDYKKSSSFSSFLKAAWEKQSILIILIGMIIIIRFLSPYFFTTTNLINIVRQISALAIIALGEYFVILTAGMDLSLGSTVSLTGVLVSGFIVYNGLNIYFAMFLVLLVGILIGAINGALIVYGKIPPFIATLATMISIKGITFIYSEGYPISGLPESFSFLGRGYIGWIPVPIIVMIVISLICYIFINHTKTGLSVLATGGNEEASRVSGIKTNKVKLLVYILSGVLAVIGGIVISSRIMAGQPNVGDNLLFDAITAVVLGGTSFFGGEGKVQGVIIGALILGVLANGMTLLGVGAYYQWLTRGIILAMAVFIDMRKAR